MLERDVGKETILFVMDSPDYSIKRFDETELFKKLNGKTLKVVIAEKENFIKVVTIYYLK